MTTNKCFKCKKKINYKKEHWFFHTDYEDRFIHERCYKKLRNKDIWTDDYGSVEWEDEE